MGDVTCLEYLIQCSGSGNHSNITQDLLLNASNEFRNVWNLIKKLQYVARIDVNKITRFLDNVQECLQTQIWDTAGEHGIYADHEYRQIRKYIRASYLEDYKVAKLIDFSSSSEKQKSNKTPQTLQRRKQNFRNRQINKQSIAKHGKQAIADVHKNDSSKTIDTKCDSKTVEKRTTGDGQEIVTTVDNPKANITQVITNNNKSAGVGAINNNIISIESNQNALATVTEIINDNQRNEDENNNNENPNQDIISEDKNDTVKNERSDTDTIYMCESKEKEYDGENTKQTTDKPATDESPENVCFTSELEKKNNATNEALEAEKSVMLFDNHEPIDGSNGNDDKVTDVKTRTHSSVEDNTHESTNETNVGTTPNSTNCSNVTDGGSKAINTANKTVKETTGTNVDVSSQVSDRVTNISAECTVDKIVEQLTTMYKHDWNTSLKTLTSCEPSNGLTNSISFLSEILKVSTECVKKAIENIRKTRQDWTDDIDDTLCKEKKTFLGIQLRNLQDKFGIVNSDPGGEDSINTYAAKCVELAWFMTTQNPPLLFDYDSRPMLLEDLFKLFKPYKNHGKFIQYVVWPAIRRCGTGEIIEQGVAEFR